MSSAKIADRLASDEPVSPLMRMVCTKPFMVLVGMLLAFLPWFALLGWMAEASWFLTDDAFISFRYVRNLLEGHGLVFNRGERVEGYSNFLWVLELALLWGVFGLRPEHAAPWLSVAFTVGTVAVMLWWVARLPALQHRVLVAWMALGLVCSSATFAVWTSGGGLETRQFTFFVVVAVVCLSLYRESRRALLVVSLSLAAAALTRPEGPLFAVCCFAWYAVQRRVDTGQWGKGWRAAACLVIPVVVLVAGHYLFRYSYYGEWLPNTYYAKHVRPWYEAGLRYLWVAALETGLYLLLPLAVVSLVKGWRGRRCLTYALPLLCIGSHAAYIARIGGDNFEYRPLDFYWPLLAVAAAVGIVHLGSWASITFRRLAAGARTCALILFLPVLFYSSAMQGALLVEGVKAAERIIQPHLTLGRDNAGWLLAVPGMSMLAATSDPLRLYLVRKLVGTRHSEHRNVAAKRIREWRPYEDMARDVIPLDAVMAQGAIGIQPFYLSDMRVVDVLGLADATVARNPVSRPNHRRIMAHDRKPPPGYLEKRGVNIYVYPPAFVEVPEPLVARRHFGWPGYAVKIGRDFWMPFDSPDHRWVIERFAGRDLRIQCNLFQHVQPSSNRVPIARISPPQCESAIRSYIASVVERAPVIRSDFDVYHDGNRLLYTGGECGDEAIAPPFLLHVFPEDEGDPPMPQREHGFNSLDFYFKKHRLPLARYFKDTPAPGGVKCIAVVDLPDYEIARIRTGQFVPGRNLWDGEFYVGRSRLVVARWIAKVVERAPVIRSDFDVYHDGNRLLYTGGECGDEAIAPPFLLHVFPEDEGDPPMPQREHGFNSLDFYFKKHRLPLARYFKDTPAPGGVKCIAVVDLPDYEIARIRTGQFVPGRNLWDGEFEVGRRKPPRSSGSPPHSRDG